MADLSVTVGPASTAETVAVAPHDRVIIHIEETPTTGYRWTVDLSDDVLTVDSDDFRATVGGMPGAAGERTVVLRTTRPGRSTVTLRLAREWEAEPARTVRLDIAIRDTP